MVSHVDEEGELLPGDEALRVVSDLLVRAEDGEFREGVDNPVGEEGLCNCKDTYYENES